MVEERRREAAAELPLCAAALSQQPLPLRARLPSAFCDWPGFVCRAGYVMWFVGITCIIYITLCIHLALSVCVSRRCISSLYPVYLLILIPVRRRHVPHLLLLLLRQRRRLGLVPLRVVPPTCHQVDDARSSRETHERQADDVPRPVPRLVLFPERERRDDAANCRVISMRSPG